MTWPYWVAIGAALFALGALVEPAIGRAFDRVAAGLLALPFRVVDWFCGE